MTSRSRVAIAVAATVAFAAVAVAIPGRWTAEPGDWVPPTLIFTLFAFALEFVEVPMPRNGTLSVSGVPHVALVLIAPPPFAALAVGASVLAHQVATRRPPLKAAFNVANHVLTISLASLAVGSIGAPRELLTVRPVPFGYLAAALAALVYYLVNITLTAGVISVATGRRFSYLLRTNNRSTLLPDLGAEALGVLLAASWYTMPAWVALLSIPTSVIARTLHVIRRLERETIEAVETLADSIDDRDPNTYHHSERVSEYALALAKAMNVDELLVDMIGLAARVHDLGKLGVTDALLMKPSALTESEFQTMRQHPEIGARILGRYERYRESVALVRAHHERWDGAGYPDGLAGEAIPLGARIIAVADSFDAMTSDRPYRQGLAPTVALAELRRGAGTQWDPICVAHFIRLLTDPAAVLPETPAIARLRRAAPVANDARPLPSPMPEPGLAEAS